MTGPAQSNPIVMNGGHVHPQSLPIPIPPNERHNRMAQAAAQNNVFSRVENAHNRSVLQGIAAHRRVSLPTRAPTDVMVTLDSSTNERVVAPSSPPMQQGFPIAGRIAPPSTNGIQAIARQVPLNGRIPPPESQHHR